MLSATPHDGKPKSFASLMNMLNPTAIANPEDYGPEDIKGLFIRRFKKDIKDQVATSFQERVIRIAKPQATAAEEKVFELFTGIKFTRLDQRRTAGDLFKTTLEKSLFSSPSACLQTIHNRVNRLQKEDAKGFAADIGAWKISPPNSRKSPPPISRNTRTPLRYRRFEAGLRLGWQRSQGPPGHFHRANRDAEIPR